jgi:hypothetical protein
MKRETRSTTSVRIEMDEDDHTMDNHNRTKAEDEARARL